MKIYMGKSCITQEVTHITSAWYVRSIFKYYRFEKQPGITVVCHICKLLNLIAKFSLGPANNKLCTVPQPLVHVIKLCSCLPRDWYNKDQKIKGVVDLCLITSTKNYVVGRIL